MPAALSSSIDPVLGQLATAADEGRVRAGDLLPALASVADPRARRGVRHQITTILGLATCAVLAGARSFVAIGEWVANVSEEVLAALGTGGRGPSESTMRRVLQQLDADELDTVIGGWAAERTDQLETRRVIAVDGKSLRGSAGLDRDRRHLLAAVDHRAGVVLGQVEVDDKTNEIPMFSVLLDRVDDLEGAVVTADAMHAQTGHADYLVLQRRAHFLLTVKANQPGLYDQLKALPWADVPIGHTSASRGHGRVEQRTVKVVSVSTGILFPHATQARFPHFWLLFWVRHGVGLVVGVCVGFGLWFCVVEEVGGLA